MALSLVHASGAPLLLEPHSLISSTVHTPLPPASLLTARLPPPRASTAGFNMRAPLTMVRMQEAAAAPAEEAPPAPFNGETFAKTLPGITGPLDFFDPAGFCTQEGVTEGKIRFYREVELKHCRVAMLAALGFPLAEQFHPLFATDDAPSFSAFQQTPLQTFWPVVVFAIAVPEIYSVFTFQNPAGSQPWSIKLDHTPGDLNFDPLGLKPTDANELKEMQTKELNNGRCAARPAGSLSRVSDVCVCSHIPPSVSRSQPRDDRHRRHDRPGGHHGRQALLSLEQVSMP